MSEWRKKSENNLEASRLLLGSGLHNESVHCSYYGCVQFGFHMMHAYMGMEVKEIERESHGTVNKIGTHKWIQRQIFQVLKNKDRAAAVNINNDMMHLSKLRVKADYTYQPVGKKEAAKAKETAQNIIEVLKGKL